MWENIKSKIKSKIKSVLDILSEEFKKDRKVSVNFEVSYSIFGIVITILALLDIYLICRVAKIF